MWKGGAWLQVLQFVRPPPLSCCEAPPATLGGRSQSTPANSFTFRGEEPVCLRGFFFFVRRFVFLRQFVWRAPHKALGLNIFSWIGTAIAFEATVYWFESNRMLNYFIYFIKAGVQKKKKAGSFSLQRRAEPEPLSASTHFKNLKALFFFLRSRVPWLSRLRLLPARGLFNNGLRSQR